MCDDVPVGLCPWCKKETTPELFEKNKYVRRNIYKCSRCHKKILVCYTPGCDDFARWGEFWDDYYCPNCTQCGGPISYLERIITGGRNIVKK